MHGVVVPRSRQRRALVALTLAFALGGVACGEYAGLDPVPTRAASSPGKQASPRPPGGATKRAAAPGPAPAEPARAEAIRPGVAAYRGLGSWIDVYDNSDRFGESAFGDPVGAVRNMAAHGVRTLFLETGSYRHRPIALPGTTPRFIEAAHATGMKVVAWYLPLFRDVRHDFRDATRTIAYRTPHGQAFDGFALDIEAAAVPPRKRIQHFLELSALIRRAVGPRYALGAIIPSPRGLIRVPSYWPGFPYAQLPRYYDVILPMSYYTFHYQGPAATYRYITDNVRIVRMETNDPSIPIHVIGGIADQTSQAETAAFVRAAKAAHVFGASMYEYGITTPRQWALLKALR